MTNTVDITDELNKARAALQVLTKSILNTVEHVNVLHEFIDAIEASQVKEPK